MPELPEVERASRMIREEFNGSKITDVQVVDDDIVFNGCSAADFATHPLKGKDCPWLC